MSSRGFTFGFWMMVLLLPGGLLLLPLWLLRRHRAARLEPVPVRITGRDASR